MGLLLFRWVEWLPSEVLDLDKLDTLEHLFTRDQSAEDERSDADDAIHDFSFVHRFSHFDKQRKIARRRSLQDILMSPVAYVYSLRSGGIVSSHLRPCFYREEEGRFCLLHPSVGISTRFTAGTLSFSIPPLYAVGSTGAVAGSP